MKIGFCLWGSDSWLAATNYLIGLLNALKETNSKDVSLCFLLDGKQNVPSDLKNLAAELDVSPRISRGTPEWFIDRFSKRLLGYDWLHDRALRDHGIQVIVFGDAPRGSKIPALSWIPDFQHVRLPEMFSDQERRQRDRWFTQMAERASRIILLSETVKRDFEAFAPKFAYKARVLSPVPFIPAEIYEQQPECIYECYNLPKKFVYLPSQFWKHKNHRIAFQAVQILKQKWIELFLVCSGFPGDYREPSYFSRLLHELAQMGIRNQVALLGLLPRKEVFALMRQSICVLNPSLFEGFGMSANEARFVGKSIVLSDIPAHRELNPPAAIFFDPNNAQDLANKLQAIWRDKSPGPDLALEEKARFAQPERIRQHAQTFMSIVEEVVDDK